MRGDSTQDCIRIVLADDHNLFRQSLKIMLEQQPHFSVIAEATNGLQAVAKARDLMPDIVLMDIRMPMCSGVEALKQIGRELPGVHVVMLTVSEGDEDLFAAIKSGARGYLLKTAESEDVVRAIEQVSRGGAVVSPTMALRILDEFGSIELSTTGSDTSVAGLTTREKEILELLGQGLSNREIADSLTLAESTVKSHARNIMEKLHLHNRAQAVAFAARHSPARRRARID